MVILSQGGELEHHRKRGGTKFGLDDGLSWNTLGLTIFDYTTSEDLIHGSVHIKLAAW